MLYEKMFPKIIAFIFCLLSFISLAGNGNDEINSYNKSGKKEGKWIVTGKDRPGEGYPANGKVEEGSYSNGRKEGLWIKYHTDGKTPRLIGYYKDNRPSGNYSKFNEKGVRIEKGAFSNGQYSDTIIRYHDNGQIAYQGFYARGKENGQVKFFFPNGKTELEYTALDGTPSGKSTRYYESGGIREVIELDTNGNVKNREFRKEEKPAVIQLPPKTGELPPKIVKPIVKGGRFSPNGYNKVYNNDDEIWQDGDFVDGRLFDGKLYVYDRDGILLKVKIFKNGIYHSDGQL